MLKKLSTSKNQLNICFVSTYPPRECGLASYTQKLRETMEENDKNIKTEVVAIKFDDSEKYNKDVNFIIERDEEDDYDKAAEYINNSDADVVSIQHEFGIFGGQNGKNIVLLLEKLKKPVMMTLHSIPIRHQKKSYSSRKYKSKVLLLRKILKYVSSVVIMSESVKEIAREDLCFSGKIAVINHGTQTFSKEEINKFKLRSEELNIEKNDFIISTYGLISPRKGLQFVIKALPSLIKDNPKVKIKYFILGMMHPTESKKYLTGLESIAKKLHVEQNVVFDSKFLPIRKIYRYLANTDVFITPYYKGLANLTSSGTFSYALGLGCCIVSTPYVYAKEIIDKYKIGELVDFADEKSIAKKIDFLIDNPEVHEKYKNNSYQLSKEFSWENVAKKYFNLLSTFVKKS